MRILGDLTTNHTGAGPRVVRAGAGGPVERGGGLLLLDRRPSPGYVGWLEHARCPSSTTTRPRSPSRMVRGPGLGHRALAGRAVRLDGWRIDVANMTGPVRRRRPHARRSRATIRATMRDAQPGRGARRRALPRRRPDLAAGGWHANMNYSAFTRPGLDVAGRPRQHARLPRDAGADPAPRRRLDGGDHARLRRDRAVGRDAPTSGTCSARTTRRGCARSSARARRVEVAAGLLFTYPGTPGDVRGRRGRPDRGQRRARPRRRCRGTTSTPAGDRAGTPATFEIYRVAHRRAARVARAARGRDAVGRRRARRGRVPARDGSTSGCSCCWPARRGRAPTCPATCSRRAPARRTSTAARDLDVRPDARCCPATARGCRSGGWPDR